VANTLNVSLDAADRLDVDDSTGQNQVTMAPGQQTITWKLTGDLKQGDFVSMTADEPGFGWIQQPPDGIFSWPPVISADGNHLTIQDTHNDKNNSVGRWIYVLRVLYKKKVYATTHEIGRGATANNPVIINKGP